MNYPSCKPRYGKKALIAYEGGKIGVAPKIDRRILIGELVMNYPEAAEVLLQHGFYCIGCGLSAYETLEQGCSAHGFDDALIDKIVEEIKDAVKKKGNAAR